MAIFKRSEEDEVRGLIRPPTSNVFMLLTASVSSLVAGIRQAKYIRQSLPVGFLSRVASNSDSIWLT